MKTLTHIIKCHFCGIELGDIQVQADEAQESLTDEMFGIEDSRCPDCEAENGNYKEMAETYMQETGNTYEQFRLDIVEAEGKKQNLDQKVTAIKETNLAAIVEARQSEPLQAELEDQPARIVEGEIEENDQKNN